MSGLATGILKNTTTTGVPSIAIAADFPTLNQNTTGNAATVTTNANLTDVITSVGNATSIASQTGIGTTFVVNNSPTIEGTTIANITRLIPLQIQSVLEAADVADNDKFGAAVALNSTGSILAVGANLWEGSSGTDRGGVYSYLCQSDGMPQRDTFSIKSSFGTIGDSSASPGNATLNTVSGKSAISLASSSVVITNSFVSSTSMIFITPLSLDATATAWKYSVADGSFTITTNAATTADWLFSWIVFN